jgi:glycosyltransferase involved in cell wall biosynthesis
MITGTSSRHYDLAVIYRNYGLGGVERHTAELLKYLSATGLRVVLLQSGFDLRSVGVKETAGMLDIVDTGLGMRRLSRKELRAWSQLFQTNPSRRILVIKPGYVAVDPAFLRVVRRAAPVVFHIEHSLVPPVVPGPSRLHFGFLPGLGLWWRLEPWRRRRMSRLVDRVFVVSEAGKRSLIEHAYLAEEQVITCLNGLDVDRWVRDERKGNAFRDHYGIPRDCYLFGTAGRLDPLKGLDLAIRSFAQLRERGGDNFCLCNVGEGPSRGKLEQLARELKVERLIFFTGFVADMREAYSAIDTLLFPSELESCPLVLLEAMACGCRILASPIGGVPELLRDPICGDLISSRDPNDWAHLMQIHLRTPFDERLAHSARIRDFVLNNYDQRCQFQILAEWFAVCDSVELAVGGVTPFPRAPHYNCPDLRATV